MRRRSVGPSLITPGLTVLLAATLIDLLPNAGLVNYVWLMAGAVAGIVVWRPASDEAASRTGSAIGGADLAPPNEFRAGWLMAEEAAPASGRQKRSERKGSTR